MGQTSWYVNQDGGDWIGILRGKDEVEKTIMETRDHLARFKIDWAWFFMLAQNLIAWMPVNIM